MKIKSRVVFGIIIFLFQHAITLGIIHPRLQQNHNPIFGSMRHWMAPIFLWNPICLCFMGW